MRGDFREPLRIQGSNLSYDRAIICERYISAALGAAMAEHLARNTPEVAHDALSKRECAVFRALALGHPIVQIAAEFQLSPKTASTYRTRVLEKLQLKSTSDFIRYAIANRLVNR